jgi:tetratricopeptide (TPR) repeat protein
MIARRRSSARSVLQSFDPLLRSHVCFISSNQMLIKLYQNIALCHINMRQFGLAIRACDEALRLNPRSSKALFNKAKVSYRYKLDGFTSLLYF